MAAVDALSRGGAPRLLLYLLCVLGGALSQIAVVQAQDEVDYDLLPDFKLVADDAATGDNFGVSVSLDRDSALVGANFDNCAAGAACGSAYVFRLTQQAGSKRPS